MPGKVAANFLWEGAEPTQALKNPQLRAESYSQSLIGPPKYLVVILPLPKLTTTVLTPPSLSLPRRIAFQPFMSVALWHSCCPSQSREDCAAVSLAISYVGNECQ